MAEGRERFEFGPRDRRGLVAGARSGQLAVVACALAAALVALRALGGGAGAPLAVGVVVVAVAAVAWPISGRSVEEWTPVVARFASRSLAGTNRKLSPLAPRRRRPPGVLADFEMTSEAAPAGEIGALVDRRCSTTTVVLAVGGESFALLSEQERMRRVEGWASVLASLGRDAGSLHRLQWIERTLPDTGEALRARLERSAAVVAEGPGAQARASYRQLIESESETVLRHELLVAVCVRHGRGREEAAVASEAALVEERCQRGGIEVVGVLSGGGLGGALREAFESVPTGRATGWPWPTAVEATWGAFHADGLWHATYWVAEWPRHEVASDFLLPLLVAPGCRRAVSVVMAPVPPLRAVRVAEHARTSRVADAELRRRHGFALSARSRREHDAVVRREHELARGHAAFRFSAYVTVSARAPDELERACRQATHAAALSGLELRRLYGVQAEAFCLTLPVGRGCG